jgi:hypothetical protein
MVPFFLIIVIDLALSEMMLGKNGPEGLWVTGMEYCFLKNMIKEQASGKN